MGALGPAGPSTPGPVGPQGPQGNAGPRGPAGAWFGEEAAAFAGFTSTPITANAGGREQMHARCAAAFPGSHLCHMTEYELAVSTTPIPTIGAWIDNSAAANGDPDASSLASGRVTGRNPFGNCANWTSVSGNDYATSLEPGGGALRSCAGQHVLACCSTPYREVFRGYTTATTTGSSGGRAQMHARCAAELPGSHLCHVAEYHRATPTVTPPANGAWIDQSGAASTDAVVNTSVAARDAGRWTSRTPFGNCANWTDLAASSYGVAVSPSSAVITSCAQSLPLACCE